MVYLKPFVVTLALLMNYSNFHAFSNDNELILFCPVALKLGRGDNLGSLMLQVALLEEQRNEAAENEGAEKVEESKSIDADSGAAEPARKNETLDEKPDINDVPMDESQVKLCVFLCLRHVSLLFLPFL